MDSPEVVGHGSHVPLGTARWRLWREVALRGAGFPASAVDVLRDPELAAAADASALDGGRWDRIIARLWARCARTAADPALREAVAWQNPQAVTACLDKLARGEPRNARGRLHEATLASYLQRYCLKNDTIGHFGPVGWARLVPDRGGVLTAAPGAALVSRRTTYFECWAIDALARAIAEREDLPIGRVPAQAFPERHLQAALARTGRAAARTRALGQLAELVAARDRLAQAAGSPDEVLAAWASLTEVFRRHTGMAPARRAGRTYAGRLLCYQDAVRDVEVRIGAGLLDLMARPLGLVLDSARWLMAETGERYQEIFTTIYDRECARRGGDAVPAARLLGLATPDLLAAPAQPYPDPVRSAVTEFQRRWCEILAVPPGARRHAVSSPAIAAGVSRLFPARPVAWSAATQHSPDLLVAGPLTPDGVQLILGELHLAVNTLESRLFVEQHPDRDRLLAAAEADHGDRRVYLLPRADAPAMTSRTLPPSALLSPRYTYVGRDADAAAVAVLPGPMVPLAELVVERRGERLVVCAPGRGIVLDFMELAGEVLSGAVLNAFQPLAEARHRPRVTIDRLVLCRESWSFPAAEVDWAAERDERARFVSARRWRATNGMPERAFYRVPGEAKPRAVDFASPALVSVLAKAVRGADTLTVVEMLPAPGRLWLRDRDDRQYTSEFRFVAVDSM